MAKLIPFKPSMLKQMGIVNTKQGPMVDSSKLSDYKKYQKPEVKIAEKTPIKSKEKKETKEVKPRINSEERNRRESMGVY